MSLQQLEAFLAWAQEQPSLLVPLAAAPDAEAVAAIAAAAGFDVSSDDLLAAAGEPPEVVRMVEIVSLAGDPPLSELEAFLQQVEIDPDLQRVLAAAPDAEGVAALARVAGFGVSANDLWAASDETPDSLAEPELVLEFWPDPAESPSGDGNATTTLSQGAQQEPEPPASSAAAAPSPATAAAVSPEDPWGSTKPAG